MFANLHVRFRERCNQQLDSGILKSGLQDRADISGQRLNGCFQFTPKLARHKFFHGRTVGLRNLVGP